MLRMRSWIQLSFCSGGLYIKTADRLRDRPFLTPEENVRAPDTGHGHRGEDQPKPADVKFAVLADRSELVRIAPTDEFAAPLSATGALLERYRRWISGLSTKCNNSVGFRLRSAAGSCHKQNERRLQNCCLVEQSALGEALWAEYLDVVHDAGGAVENQVRGDLPRRRSVHHTMTTEAIGAEEARQLRRQSYDGVMVGRHLVESSPRTLRVHCQVLEAGHAVGGVHQDLLNERRFQVVLISRRLLRIVPGQEEPTARGAEVEAIRHVNDHGNRMRNAIEGFGWDQHAAQRFDRKIDARQCSRLRCPRTGSVDHHGRAHRATRCSHTDDAAPVTSN